jgi:hypothetical protein
LSGSHALTVSRVPSSGLIIFFVRRLARADLVAVWADRTRGMVRGEIGS